MLILKINGCNLEIIIVKKILYIGVFVFVDMVHLISNFYIMNVN